MTKVTFLGTADSIPSAHRNHNAILITEGAENILVDCGEGTQRQFRRAKLNPCKVTKILITHWHGDHVLGLPGLLSTLALSGYNKTLFIYGPEGTEEKFWDMLRVFSFKREYDIVYHELGSGEFAENDDFVLESEYMEHGVPCLAYSFTKRGHVRIKPEIVKKLGPGKHMKDLLEGNDVVFESKKFKPKDCVYKEDDKKISIVMDTRMNDNIVPFVMGSDLFISEGTYSKELKKEAEEHMHMTVEQVAKAAKKAKVKKLVITHVSSRYLRNLKALLVEAGEIFDNTIMPKDLDFIEF